MVPSNNKANKIFAGLLCVMVGVSAVVPGQVDRIHEVLALVVAPPTTVGDKRRASAAVC